MLMVCITSFFNAVPSFVPFASRIISSGLFYVTQKSFFYKLQIKRKHITHGDHAIHGHDGDGRGNDRGDLIYYY